jgi:tetratricopeptide (TPR) repeat protein
VTLARVLLLAALIAPASSAQATDVARARFDEGVRAYAQADWAAAERAWRECLESTGPGGPSRAQVLYDLGNAAYRQQRPLEAVAYFTASLRLAPRDRDAWHNLELARREAGLEPADRGDLAATARRLATSLTAAESGRLVLVLGGLLALAFVWEALRGGAPARASIAVAVVAVAAAGAQWTWLRSREARDLWLVCAREGAPLRSEPREAAATIARLAPASEVERVDELPGWLRVKDGASVGWIESADAIAIAAPRAR